MITVLIKHPSVFFVAQMITSKFPICFLCLLWLQWVSSVIFHVCFQRTDQKGQHTKDIGPKRENPMLSNSNNCMERNTCHVRDGWYRLHRWFVWFDFLEKTYELCEGGHFRCILSLISKYWETARLNEKTRDAFHGSLKEDLIRVSFFPLEWSSSS